MKARKRNRKAALHKRVDELHRSPTWFERFRAWIQRLPRLRLYVGLTVLTWLSLTALIGLGTRLPIERTVAQGIIESGDLQRLESLIQDPNPWTVLLGVG